MNKQPRKNAVGITSYILDGLCGGNAPPPNNYIGNDIKTARNVFSTTRTRADPILFGINVDNAFARRIDRGISSDSDEINRRVTQIIGRCTQEKVHLIAAQVKMPVHEENGVRLRTELDAIGFQRAERGHPASAVVIELKTCNNNNTPRSFTQPTPRQIPSVGYRHVVQVGFGMHCIKRMIDERGVDLNVRGLLLYSTRNGCICKWIELNNNVVAQRAHGLFAHPVVSASYRRKLEFKKTTWRRVKMPEWPTGLRGRAIRDAIGRMPSIARFKGAVNIKGIGPEKIDANVSAVLKDGDQYLFVCLIIGRDSGTKKRTRINTALSLITRSNNNNISFAIVKQSRGGWLAEEMELPPLLP